MLAARMSNQEMAPVVDDVRESMEVKMENIETQIGEKSRAQTPKEAVSQILRSRVQTPKEVVSQKLS